MKNATEEYIDLIREYSLLTKSGQLSEEQENLFLEALDEVWKRMTREERIAVLRVP